MNVLLRVGQQRQLVNWGAIAGLFSSDQRNQPNSLLDKPAVAPNPTSQYPLYIEGKFK